MLKLAYFIVHKVYHNEADERGKKNQEMKHFLFGGHLF